MCGLLARTYLYSGDKVKALLNAREVIDVKKFPWTNATDFLAVDADKKDRIFYKELLFAWYIPGMNSNYNNDWFQDNNSAIYLDQDEAKTIYEVAGAGGGDMRYTQWFGTVSVGNSFISSIHKYRRNTLGDSFVANLHYLVAPAIRLSEIYYIAAEYQLIPNFETNFLRNTVRKCLPKGNCFLPISGSMYQLSDSKVPQFQPVNKFMFGRCLMMK